VSSDVEVENLATAVLDHKEAVQQLECQRPHREEVKGHDRFAVILEKRKPPFIPVATAWNSSQISSHAPF